MQSGMNDASGHEGCEETNGHGWLGLLQLPYSDIVPKAT